MQEKYRNMLEKMQQDNRGKQLYIEELKKRVRFQLKMIAHIY